MTNTNIIDLSAGGGDQNKQTSTAMVAIEQSRAVQEVQAALIIAKRFPRDEAAAISRIMNECQRPTLANVAVYEYAKGGTKISGPSIRLAEVLKRHWGNIQSGFRVLEADAQKSTVQAYAWDQETNVKEEKTFVVKHWRDTKSGGYAIRDEREIYELIANQAMRRVRACILSIVPGDIAEMATEECERTLSTNANITPERIKAMLDAFASYGVTRAAIEKRIQRNLDSISPAQFVSLGKIANSLKDGMGAAADFFEIEVAAEKAAAAPAGTKTKPQNMEALKAATVHEAKPEPKDDVFPGDLPNKGDFEA